MDASATATAISKVTLKNCAVSPCSWYFDNITVCNTPSTSPNPYFSILELLLLIAVEMMSLECSYTEKEFQLSSHLWRVVIIWGVYSQQ